MSQKTGFDFPFDKARHIKMLILDVDGVMTDGSIIMDKNGDELKAFNVRDGHGIKLLQRMGIKIAIITGRTSPVVEARANDLGIDFVTQKSLNKDEALAALEVKSGITAEHCAMMGDDIIDLPPMYRCGLSLAPADACLAVLNHVDWVSGHPGGRGAIRQAAEAIILAQGSWNDVMGRYRVTPADSGWST